MTAASGSPTAKVTYSDFVLDDTISALKRAGLDKARIGLVGMDVLTYRMTQRLKTALPDLVLEPADDLLAGLRSIKSPGEIALLRKASEIGSRTIEAMLNASVPGASHGDIVAAGLAHLVPARGVLYNSFMASGNGNDPSRFAKSNFPTWGSQKRIAPGDWIRFGISGAVDGSCSTCPASSRAGHEPRSSCSSPISCIEATLAAIRPGATAGDPGPLTGQAAVARVPRRFGVFSAKGHGPASAG